MFAATRDYRRALSTSEGRRWFKRTYWFRTASKTLNGSNRRHRTYIQWNLPVGAEVGRSLQLLFDNNIESYLERARQFYTPENMFRATRPGYLIFRHHPMHNHESDRAGQETK